MRNFLNWAGRRFLPALVILICCSESPIDVPEKSERIVLAEDFSFARCTYCPYAEHALDSLSREYGESLAVIIYHRRQLGDTLSPPYIATRESLYHILSSPTVVFDGIHIVQTENPNDDYMIYKQYITTQKSAKTKLFLHLDSELSADSVDVTVNIGAMDSLNNNHLNLFLVVYENDVFFKQLGAPDSIFDYVVRKIVPDENGMEFEIDYLDSLTKQVSFALSPNWNTDKLGIVAFVQDMETKEVLQAAVNKKID